MKLKDIITESETSYASYEPDNAEALEYADRNKDRYRKLFRDFYKRGEVFVYDTDDHHPSEDEPMTNKPREDERTSAGYRGNQVAKRRAGLDYDSDVFD